VDASNPTIELAYALDTFYFLISGALVMWMAAGFAMLEAGMVRAKNTAEILLKNVALYAIACVMYLVLGYSIMYGDPVSSLLPGIGIGLPAENTAEAVLGGGEGAPYYANHADFFFQVVFVATAMSIVSGAVAERMRLWSFLAFAVVMTAVIYPIQGFWHWGGGFLSDLGFADFAGSGVVHLAGATAALVGVALVGPRHGRYDDEGRPRALPGANMPVAALGTFVLWLGWFGFNGGSQLAVSSIGDANAVAHIFVNTNAAAAGGVLAALVTARLRFGKADLTMALNGALAGLVAITAEPAAPGALLATAIGAIGGVIVVFAIIAVDRLRLDDPVGAISVHGIAGIWGLLVVPLSNDGAALWVQAVGIAVIVAWVGLTSLVVWWALDRVLGLRVSSEQEYGGIDVAECGLEAYPEFTRTHTFAP
jgi:Amt family ammonium transporter